MKVEGLDRWGRRCRSARAGRSCLNTLRPTPFTLHPAPYLLRPAHCIPHSARQQQQTLLDNSSKHSARQQQQASHTLLDNCSKQQTPQRVRAVACRLCVAGRDRVGGVGRRAYTTIKASIRRWRWGGWTVGANDADPLARVEVVRELCGGLGVRTIAWTGTQFSLGPERRTALRRGTGARTTLRVQGPG